MNWWWVPAGEGERNSILVTNDSWHNVSIGVLRHTHSALDGENEG